MTQVGNGERIHVDLRPLIGLLNGVSEPVIERLASDAVRKHRDLVERAETLFNDLPDDVKMGRQAAGEDHLAYLKATIDMHAQMSALTTLLKILGRTPSV